MLNTDAKDLAQARASWNARKSASSIIAWTLSPEWTNLAYAKSSLYGNRRGTVHNHKANTVKFRDICHGEITNAR